MASVPLQVGVALRVAGGQRCWLYAVATSTANRESKAVRRGVCLRNSVSPTEHQRAFATAGRGRRKATLSTDIAGTVSVCAWNRLAHSSARIVRICCTRAFLLCTVDVKRKVKFHLDRLMTVTHRNTKPLAAPIGIPEE